MRLLIYGCFLTLVGCAHYVERTRDVREAYRAYDEPRALALLEARFGKGDPGIDKLLVLLDYGTVLHAAGRWAESRDMLAKADELSQQLDFTSVSEEAGSLLANETMRTYRGEDFEKLMITVLQALNYAQLGDDEGALVEIRRCNERLEKMIAQQKPYEQLAIARYLGGMLYEDQHQWDAAAIDYLEAARLQPNLGNLSEPVLRLAKLTERVDAYAKEASNHLGLVHGPLGADEGQIAVVIEAGQAPAKEEGQSPIGKATFVVVPVYTAHTPPVPTASVLFSTGSVEATQVTSLDAVARLHLQDRIGRMIARSLASAGIKAGLAAAVGVASKSEELGVLTFGILALTQQADTRSWLSLPAEFQIARARVKAGSQTVSVTWGTKTTEHRVDVAPGRLKMVVVRRY